VKRKDSWNSSGKIDRRRYTEKKRQTEGYKYKRNIRRTNRRVLEVVLLPREQFRVATLADSGAVLRPEPQVAQPTHFSLVEWVLSN
jgi:hypothetical protein